MTSSNFGISSQTGNLYDNWSKEGWASGFSSKKLSFEDIMAAADKHVKKICGQAEERLEQKKTEESFVLIEDTLYNDPIIEKGVTGYIMDVLSRIGSLFQSFAGFFYSTAQI